MRLPPMMSYYGSKWAMARKYPPPKFRTIIEPFAGGAGYSLNYAYHDVVLYDVDPKVCGVWDFLIHASAADILALPLLAPGDRVDALNICQEAKWLIGWWCGCCIATPVQTLSSWGVRHVADGWPSTWGPGCRARIAEAVPHLRHWKVLNASYLEAENREATWFIDPPYQKAGRFYAHGCGGLDFESLGEWCRGRSGQAIVCENAGASWLQFERLSDTKSNRVQRNGGRKSEEVVWTNHRFRLL